MKKLSQKITYWLGVVAIGLVAGVGIQFVQAWTEPAVAPPGGNLGAPINTSANTQYKSGALGVGGLFETDTNTNMAILSGNVGIGTTTPTKKLEIVQSPLTIKAGIDVEGGTVDGLYIKSDGLTGIVADAATGGASGLSMFINGSSKGAIFASGAAFNGLQLTAYKGGEIRFATANLNDTVNTVKMTLTNDGKLIMKRPDGNCSSCGPNNSNLWTCVAAICP